MKGNKMEVKDVPSAYTLWLARLIHQSMVTKHRMPLSKRMLKKGTYHLWLHGCCQKDDGLGVYSQISPLFFYLRLV